MVKLNIRIAYNSAKKSSGAYVYLGVRMQVVDSGQKTNKEWISCVPKNTKSKLVSQMWFWIACYSVYWSIHNLALFNNYLINNII